jgi:hypothetical protein
MKTAAPAGVRIWLGIAGAMLVILACCACLAAAGGVAAWSLLTPLQVQLPPTPTPLAARLTRTITPPATRTPTPPPPSAAPETPAGSQPTLPPASTPTFPAISPEELNSLLANVEAPPADLYDLHFRLKGERIQPPASPPPPPQVELGDRQSFWVSNGDDDSYTRVEAVLRYISAHATFWVDDGVRYNSGELAALAETFEQKIYPTNRKFFGSEASPGIDGDPRLLILYTRGLGGTVAGYFSSADTFPAALNRYSNERDMFFFSADNTSLRDSFTYATLAHEFQHMIQWNLDRNEEVWLMEGLADLAALLNGYDVGGHDRIYALNTDIPLTEWPLGNETPSPNYGAAFLFTAYFLERFGEPAAQALSAHPANGLAGVDAVLAELGAVDGRSGASIRAEDVLMDWALANILGDPRLEDGRYGYRSIQAPRAAETERIDDCPAPDAIRAWDYTVRQFGVDTIQIKCRGRYTLRFSSPQQVNLLPVEPTSGAAAFWSNRASVANPRLTRAFDFSSASGPLTLRYAAWFDLEAGFDYVYLSASTDGINWQILRTPSGTDADPQGSSYGWGYTGQSGAGPAGRLIEEVDLSAYAGQRVTLRFEAVTDLALNGPGFLLDDVTIPQIGYYADFERDDGGWLAEGFTRISNRLPQTFRLALILRGDQTRIQTLDLPPDNLLELPVELTGDLSEAVLVVIGTTRYTLQPAEYTLELQAQP